MSDQHEPYMYDQITDEEWRGLRILRAEIDRLTAQRDRLRKYIEYMEYEDWTTETVEENRERYLQPGDMTD